MAWFRKESLDEEADRLMKADFRIVFGTPEGQRVLTKLLADMCFFREDLDNEEIVLNNYAKQLLSYLSVWEEGKELMLVEKLMEASNV